MTITTLKNSKMGRLVASLLGKPSLEVMDGKVSLSEQDKEKVKAEFGDAFLKKLETVDIDAEADAMDLFNEAVNAKVAEATAKLKSSIAALQKENEILAAEPDNQKKSVRIETDSKSSSMNIDMAAAHNRLATSVISGANPSAFLNVNASALNVNELNTEFTGAMPTGVRLELVTKKIYRGFSDSQYMTRVQSNTDYIASAALMTEVSQQFTPKWTPKGAAKFTPIRIPYRRHKINVEISPAEVVKSWLVYLYEQGKSISEMPISLYIINEHILPKVLDDITTSMLGKGKFKDAGTVSTGDEGKPAKDSMDGYETILVEGKADSKCKINFFKNALNPLTMTDTQLLQYVDSFVDEISGYFREEVPIYCSEQFLMKYKRADFAVNGKYTGVENDGMVRFTNFRLIPLQSMYNSPILFVTPKENFVELVDMSTADRCITKVVEQDYDLKIFGEYSLSVGFKIAEAVYASVPDGYVPSEKISATGTLSDKWVNGGTTPVAESA